MMSGRMRSASSGAWLPHSITPLTRKMLGMLGMLVRASLDRKSTRLNSSHSQSSYAVFCVKKKTSLGPCHLRACDFRLVATVRDLDDIAEQKLRVVCREEALLAILRFPEAGDPPALLGLAG